MSDDDGSREGREDPAFAPGNVVGGKYLIDRVIGKGGMGVVVLAKHEQLDQSVAIKYLRPKALQSPAFVERFLREARVLARIRSEHVVRVHDVGTLPHGTPYMVMEYLRGTDLARLLESGPLSVERSIDYVLQACEALAEAHAAGVVHRDLKPENLFLASKSGGASTLKILDFGISKLAAQNVDPNVRVRALTADGDHFGTPAYMSPEQLTSASDVDARTDIWAIGVVFYELLTRALPFEGDGFPAICAAILTRPPKPLAARQPSLPEGLGQVIERCLQRDRDHRLRNAAEVAEALRPFAPASSHARIDHIARVVRDAGQSVRPPESLPLLPAAAEAAAPERTRQPQTTADGSSWAPPAPLTRQGRGLFVIAAVGLVVGAAGGAFIGLRQADPPKGAPFSTASPVAPGAVASSPAVSSSPPPPQPMAPPTPAPVDSERAASAPPSPPSASAEPVVAAPSVAPPQVRKPAAPKPAATSAPSPRRPAPTADPGAIINPFK